MSPPPLSGVIPAKAGIHSSDHSDRSNKSARVAKGLCGIQPVGRVEEWTPAFAGVTPHFGRC